MEITYTMIGSDGVHYGPVPLEQLKAWIDEGRVTSETKILRSDTNSWLPASQYTELGVRSAAVQVMPAAPAPRMASNLGANDIILAQRVRQGASWFYTVAVLSLINSVLALTGTGIGFIFGLGVTQAVDYIAAGNGMGAAIGIGFNVIVAGIFAMFGFFGSKRHSWSFIAGMILYGLDALLCMRAQMWLTFAVHVYVLFRLYTGLQANLRLTGANK